MADTNRIVFKNLDSIIIRVKEWVLEHYPMKYDGNVFQVYNSVESMKSGNTPAITVNNNDILIKSDNILVKNNSGQISYGDSSDALLAKIGDAEIEVKEDSAVMTAPDGKQTTFKFGTQSVTDNDTSTTLMGDRVELNCGAHNDGGSWADVGNLVADNGEIFLKDNATTSDKHGRVYIGIKPENVLNKKPHGIYLGSNLPMGYTINKSGTESLSTGTTPAEFSDFNAITSLSAGTWVVTFSMSYPTSVDGRRLCGSIFVNGVEDIESKCTQSASVAGVSHMAVSGSLIVEVPIGSTKTVRLGGYQNTGESRDVDFTWTAMRIG